MAIQESGEMYLETILILSKNNSKVRAVDVGEHMGFSKPSVSRAMTILKNEGFIEVGEGGSITLTDSGKKVAERIYSRHKLLRDILLSIGVSMETATEDACKIEHVISEESIEAIKKLSKTEKHLPK